MIGNRVAGALILLTSAVVAFGCNGGGGGDDGDAMSGSGSSGASSGPAGSGSSASDPTTPGTDSNAMDASGTDAGEDTASTTDGPPGSSAGIVYFAGTDGLYSHDLETDTGAKIGDYLPNYYQGPRRIIASPDGERLFFSGEMGTHVISTADGAELLTQTFNCDGQFGWFDDDTIFHNGVLDAYIRDYTGTEIAMVDVMGGSYASRWFQSPDGSKFAIKEGSTGIIHIASVSDPNTFTSTAATLDCGAPIWLGDGTLMGVCINSNEFYYFAEGDADITRVPNPDPGYDVIDATVWTGDNQILIHYRANGTGGAVGNRWAITDSAGNETGEAAWLSDVPAQAGLELQHIRISADDSTVVWTNASLYRADASDGGNQTTMNIATNLAIYYDWTSAK